jgi:hypothetical protein
MRSARPACASWLRCCCSRSTVAGGAWPGCVTARRPLSPVDIRRRRVASIARRSRREMRGKCQGSHVGRLVVYKAPGKRRVILAGRHKAGDIRTSAYRPRGRVEQTPRAMAILCRSRRRDGFLNEVPQCSGPRTLDVSMRGGETWRR